jgi:hypothetical protein
MWNLSAFLEKNSEQISEHFQRKMGEKRYKMGKIELAIYPYICIKYMKLGRRGKK